MAVLTWLCLLSPNEFINIAGAERLRDITPANLLDPPSSKKRASDSAYSGCVKWFPKACGHWAANRPLITQITHYHDATKHRHSVVVGQARDENIGVTAGQLLLPSPKASMSDVVFDGQTVGHSQEHTLQSLAYAYRGFMTDWLEVISQELETHFGKLPED